MKYVAPLLLICVAACSGPSSNGHEASGPVKREAVTNGSSDQAGEGPFGINVGTKLTELSVQGERDTETGVSLLSAAPKASTQFPSVGVISFPSTGVCEIRSGSREFENDPYLTAAIPFVDEVAGALKAKYGEAKLEDDCSGYSCRSEYKLQAIEDGSRWYRYHWKSDQKRQLPNNISQIYLYVAHSEFNNSHVRLDYQFDNAKACEAAAKSAKSSAL